MKKEEFPTFLNEQPTIVFGRTGRELLIIAVGLGVAYLSWLRLGNLIPASTIATYVIKGLLAAIMVAGAIAIAFINVATRPLEEWAFVWLFYVIIPKTYIYIPTEESFSLESQSEVRELIQSGAKSNDDDYYEDD